MGTLQDKKLICSFCCIYIYKQQTIRKKLKRQLHLHLHQTSTIPRNESKKVKDLLNNKTLMKGIEDDRNRWIDRPCSWIRRITIVKMTILSKVIYIFSEIPTKYHGIFHITTTDNFKISIETQKILNRKKNLEKNKAGRKYHVL